MLLDIVKKDSTDRSVTIRIVDATDGSPETAVEHNTAGIDLWYRRPGAAKTSITEAALAALTTAHTDGGIEHIGDGYYRLDLPDAAYATGAEYVDVGGTVTGMVVIGGRVRLTDFDLDDGTRGGLTALPNAAADAAGGLPISDAGGLDLDGRLDAAVSSRQPSGAVDLNADQSGVTIGTVGTLTGHTVQTGDSFARLGAPAGASVSADVAAVKAVADTAAADVANIDGAAMRGTDSAATAAGLTSAQAAIQGDIAANTITILGSIPSAADNADAVCDEALSGHTTAGTVGKAISDVLADTNELQTDWADGGRLDALVDAITVLLEQDWQYDATTDANAHRIKVYQKGTATLLLTKLLKDTTGAAISSTSTPLGGMVEL